MLVKCLQSEKANISIDSSLSGSLMLVKAVHPLNVESRKLLTLSGIVKELIEVQPENADSPKYVKESGSIILSMLWHPEKE